MLLSFFFVRTQLSQMQKELDALADMAALNEDMDQDPDPEADANNTAQIMEVSHRHIGVMQEH